MSSFCENFNRGFVQGMFNRMCLNSFMNFSFPSISFPNFSFLNFSVPIQSCFVNNFQNFNNFNYFNNSFPSIWDNNAFQQFNYFPQTFDYSIDHFSNIPSFYNTDTFVKTQIPKKEKKESIIQTDGDFDKMLKFVLDMEGGYVANDGGQACNKGIQQATYDSYRNKKGLSKQNVKNITDEEVKDIYYTMYYKASGADKIKDAKMALYVFDTAVNMGVSVAKKMYQESNGDLDKFENLRIARYENIVKKNSKKQKYLNGWKNRVAKAESYANKTFVA